MIVEINFYENDVLMQFAPFIERIPKEICRIGNWAGLSLDKVSNIIWESLDSLGDVYESNPVEPLLIYIFKEAQEKDKAIADMLRFFKDIWVDEINQNTFTQIVNTVNLSPACYGLQRHINLESGSLGFDYDLWDKSLSLLEKKAFIGFINKMLWQNVIDDEIANWTTSLQPDAIHRLRVLNKKTIVFLQTI